VAQSTPHGTSWQGSLRDLARIINTIRRSHAFGRLTLRNTVRLGVAHLYFHSGRLVHVVSSRGDASATLNDLRDWARAIVRFERGISVSDTNVGADEEHERLLDDVIAHLQLFGVVTRPEAPPKPRVIESHLVITPQAEQLITPWEWQLLVEGTRRISLAVAHLVGAREAMSVLRDILDDCSSAFPALSGLQIASSGYLRVSQTSQLDRAPRAELLEGFAALFATCQHFCSPIIGEEDAHKLIIQGLNDIGPALVSLGVFQLDKQLLSNN
jgi:hypothetical protein